MSAATFAAAGREILRVLAADGIVLSRGSMGNLEAALAAHGRLLIQTPLVTVWQRREPLDDLG
jgi:hypothetical protein